MAKTCPMLFTRRDMSDVNGCCGDRCAWWNSWKLECCILTLAMWKTRKSYEEKERPHLHEMKLELKSQFMQSSLDPMEIEC